MSIFLLLVLLSLFGIGSNNGDYPAWLLLVIVPVFICGYFMTKIVPKKLAYRFSRVD